jgi:hypothetical protein
MSDPLNGTVFGLPGIPAFKQSSPCSVLPTVMGGILGTTSYYCFHFLLRGDLHGPLQIFAMLLAWEGGTRAIKGEPGLAACIFTNVAADPSGPRISTSAEVRHD